MSSSSPMRLVHAVTGAAPPYPPDTSMASLSFELDIERAQQSKTWLITPVELRPWLLMLWATSWTGRPAGSYDDDDETIAARIGMPLVAFQVNRPALMRGWKRASDGRLYHPVITEQILRHLASREKWRTKWRKQHGSEPARLSADSPETLRGLSGENGKLSGDSPYGVGVGVGVGLNLNHGEGESLRGEGKKPAPAPGSPVAGSFLPDDWTLPDEWRDYAVRAHKLSPQDAVRISLLFRDHWIAKPGKDGRKRNWLATWRKWVTTECDRRSARR